MTDFSRRPAAELWARVRDLVTSPQPCPGCANADPGPGWACERCLAELSGLAPLRASPGLAGAPPCLAAGGYRGPLRGCLLAFKERGRRDLAEPLSRLLAGLVGDLGAAPVLLCPIPATRAARCARGFDHVNLLCRLARARLPGCRVVPALRALPRPDSVTLTVAQRESAAIRSLRVVAGGVRRVSRRLVRFPQTRVLLVDDVVTSGATLVAAARVLRSAGITVDAAVTIAATVRNRGARDKIRTASGGDIRGPTRYCLDISAR